MYTVLEEPVNVAYMTSVVDQLMQLNLRDIQQSYNWQYDGTTIIEILQIFIARAQLHGVGDDGIGKVTVIYTDQKTSPGLKGRRLSGLCSFKPCDVPDAVRHEVDNNINKKYVGISAFRLPRVLRHVVRHGTKVDDVDACNMLFSYLRVMLQSYNIKDNIDALVGYMDHKAERRQAVATAFGVEVDDAKELILSISNGGGLDKWARERALTIDEANSCVIWLRRLQRQMDGVMRLIFNHATPEQKAYAEQKACDESGRRPHVTHFAYAWMHGEREFIDGCEALCKKHGVTVTSFEHDGFNKVQSDVDIVAIINASSTIKVDIKPPPTDPLAELKQRYLVSSTPPPREVLVLAVGVGFKLVTSEPYIRAGCGSGVVQGLVTGGPRGQTWRIAKVSHAGGNIDTSAVTRELHAHMPQISPYFLISVGIDIIILYKHAGPSPTNSTSLALPALDQLLQEPKVVHMTVGKTGERKEPLIVALAREMASAGIVIAGTMELVTTKRQDGSEYKKYLSRHELLDELSKHKPEDIEDLIADAKLAVHCKEATPFQVSLNVLQIYARDWMTFRAKLGQTIRAADDGPVYPNGVNKANINQLKFFNITPAKKLEELTLDEVFNKRQAQDIDEIELCYQKSIWFLAGSGQGKTQLSRALARRECIRQGLATYFDGKGNFDGFGLLTKEGHMANFAAFVLGDFTFTYGQRERLDMESIKAIIRTGEQAEHRARYYNGKWPAERVRLFSLNATDLDTGGRFLDNGLLGLAALAHYDQEAIDKLSDDQYAIARACVICVVPDKLMLVNVASQPDDERMIRARQRRERQRAYDEAQAAAAAGV